MGLALEKKKLILPLLFNPFSANVEYTPHDGDVNCSSCSASYKQNH